MVLFSQYTDAAVAGRVLQCEYRPARYRVGTDSSYSRCSWPNRNAWARLTLCIAFVLVVALMVWGVVRRVRIILWLGVMCALLAVFSSGYLMYIDSDAVRKSQSWCSSVSTYNCAYAPLALLCVMDAVSAVAWLLLAFATFQYNRHHLRSTSD